MWQTLERKSGFVRALLSRDTTVRSIEDVSESQVLSCAEVKAIALGDPLALELATAEQELAKLTRQLRAHQRSQTALRQIASHARDAIHTATTELPALRAAAAAATPTTADLFRVTVAGHVFTDRVQAATTLWDAHLRHLPTLGYLDPPASLGQVCHLGGHPITAQLTRDPWGQLRLDLRADVPRAPAQALDLTGLDRQPLRIIRAAERAAAAVAGLPGAVAEQIDADTRTLAAAERDIGAPFRHTERLAQVTAQVTDLTTALAPPDPLADLAADPLALGEDHARGR